MSFEITGKLVVKYNTMQRSETFKTREFVIEKSDDINGRIITNYIKFQAVQDRTAIVDRFQEGENVKVYFNIKGTRWEKDGKVNYITNLDAWRIEHLQAAYQQPVEADSNAFQPADDDNNDLPF